MHGLFLSVFSLYVFYLGAGGAPGPAATLSKRVALFPLLDLAALTKPVATAGNIDEVGHSPRAPLTNPVAHTGNID